ncbi:hypothetical protein [Embleya sp. NPDC059259]
MLLPTAVAAAFLLPVVALLGPVDAPARWDRAAGLVAGASG